MTAKPRETATQCPLCEHSSRAVLTLAHARVWQCTNDRCGLQFADPQLNEEELARAYTKLYYPANGSKEGICFDNTPEETFYQLFQKLEARIGSLKGRRVLDYGCGRGVLLRVAAQFGLQVSGIESDPEARSVAAAACNASVYPSVNELLNARPNSSFDLIIIWTVIEHLRCPWKELEDLRHLLEKRGLLLISTMDIRCLRARLERHRWHNYKNPTHLYYFDRVSLGRAIDRAGFKSFSEWRLRFRHPCHGPLRYWAYTLSHKLHLSDGLFYVCGEGVEPETRS